MSDDFATHTKCPLPWISVTIETNGNFRVCCFSNEGIYNQENKPLNIFEHSIHDAIQSETHKQLRKALSSNIQHPNCEVCWKRERAAQTLKHSPVSTRMKKLSDPTFNQSHIPEIDDQGKLLDNNIISLDLRLSNLCNMKCIMCSPFFSNLWYQDWEELMGVNKFSYAGSSYIIDKKHSDIPSWENSPNWWNEFDKIKSNIRHLYILGGEPFINKANQKILDILVQHDLAKNIHIEYDTNLSVAPLELIEKLKRFKRVDIFVSVEDIEDKYELIRFPGKFDRLVNNLETLKKNGLHAKALSCCVGTYSLFSPFRIYNYFSKLGYHSYNIRHIRYPARYDVSFLPDEVKIDVIKKYSEMELPLHYKKYLISYLYNSMGQHNEEQVKRFVTLMDKLDDIRKTNWRKTFPDVECYFK